LSDLGKGRSQERPFSIKAPLKSVSLAQSGQYNLQTIGGKKMANIQIINPALHKDLRVTSAYQAELGHAMGAIMILPSEILEAQREYPILFRKHPETGQLLTIALLGFKQEENLFLADNASWNAKYVPLAMSKGPFVVGVDKSQDEERMMICINRDDPRVGEEKGEPLFDEEGNPSHFLEAIRRNLFRLHEGLADTKKMVDAFLALNLIESVGMDIRLNNGEHINFSGAYTINTENLSQLSAEQLQQLNIEGYLSLAYFIAGSLNNVNRLIEFKNKKNS
jgi:hypothetical protein